MTATRRILTAALAVAGAAWTLATAETPAEPPRQAETQPASQPASRPSDAEIHADAVIRSLLSERAQRPVLPEAPTTRPAEETAAPQELIQPLPMPPGSMIVDREGRLIRDEAAGWWMFHFESEKQYLYEAPLRVLPNRHLEAMETILEKSATPGLRFLVTGELTQYRGNQYLLIRKKLLKRQMGSY